MNTRDKYALIVLQNVPRLLSQLDRNDCSITYGCFDRNFWQYKIRDFPSMILQQGALVLALLYKNPFKGNFYFKKEKIKKWTISALNFWAENQLSDGSFNEYYPNEHGYPPTVFTLFSTSESYKTLKLSDDILIDAMIKASRFISKKTERGAVNQEIASIASLYNVYLITREKWITSCIKKKLKFIMNSQSNEGWLPEYGGADIGYLSVSLNYLAEYYRLSGDKKIIPTLKKIIDFAQYFVNPNGTIGGDYGSRDTEYFLPNGLEILSPKYPLAGSIADKLTQNYEKCFSVDDRYLSHYFLHNFLNAFLNYKPRKKTVKLPCEKKTEMLFEEAGLFQKNNHYFCILGLSKGGILKIFKKDRLLISDCGYKIADGKKIFVSNWVSQDNSIKRDGNIFTISGKFHQVNQYLPTPLKHTGLRLSSFFIGDRLIPILKKSIITQNKTIPVYFERKISLFDNKITVDDFIKSKRRLDKILTCDLFSLRYAPSSKFFQINDIDSLNIDKTIENAKQIKIKKEFDIKYEKVKISLIDFI